MSTDEATHRDIQIGFLAQLYQESEAAADRYLINKHNSVGGDPALLPSASFGEPFDQLLSLKVELGLAEEALASLKARLAKLQGDTLLLCHLKPREGPFVCDTDLDQAMVGIPNGREEKIHAQLDEVSHSHHLSCCHSLMFAAGVRQI